MDEDDWDDIVDLDYGGEATGDRQLDELGYRLPRGATDPMVLHQKQLARDREQRRNITKAIRDAEIERNRRETRQRNRARRGEPVPAEPQPQPVHRHPVVLSGDELPAREALEVIHGAGGRPAGWYRVDVSANGAQWTKVDQPGDGPRVTASTPTPEPVQPQPAARRRWWHRRPAPVELTEPSPSVQVW
jgi:hypothetical protein